MTNLVSIIVPVYNCKPYLEDCIQSVLAQDYGNLELLLIDDGSTDGSGQICDQYAASSTRKTRVSVPPETPGFAWHPVI